MGRGIASAGVLACALAAAALVGCSGGDAAGAPGSVVVLDTVGVGAAPGSTWPNLAADAEGHLVASWLEPSAARGAARGAEPAADEPRYRLRFARLDGGRWTPPRTIVDRADLLANWADFPAVVPLGGARLAAWWPRRNDAAAAGGFAYDALVTTSADGGATWTRPTPLHQDGTPTEHGFVSFLPVGARGDSVGAVWLDGRDYARPGATDHRMQLAAATVGDDGAPAGEHMLDVDVCTCCRTSAARTRRGVVVAYRDRLPGEVRDIAVARYENGRWAPPTRVHADGWAFPGCPVNGAVAAAHGDTVAIAWFTAPHDSARVNVAFSTDGGRTFGPPTRVDDGHPAGRAGVAVDATGAATVTWIERTAPTSARLAWRTAEAHAKGAPVGGSALRVRRVALDGTRGPGQTLVASTEARASGFPQLAALGDTVFLAWTEPRSGNTPSRVRIARMTRAGDHAPGR